MMTTTHNRSGNPPATPSFSAVRVWSGLVSSWIAVLLSCLCLTFAGQAAAQQAITIAATVNDKMISLLDVDSRITLSMHLADLPNTLDNRRRMVGQVLRSIIDEKLKLQEAKLREITVSRQDIARAEADFEQRAGLKKGGLRDLFRRLGIDSSSFLERLESHVAWSKLVTRRYLPTIDIGEKEIDDYLAEFERNKGKPEYLVSEIFLPTNDKQDTEQVRALADRLIEQINAGASFAAVARNFSQSPTAAAGGNLGWHPAGQLPREIDALIASLKPGQISRPLVMPEGIFIIHLEDRRVIDPFRQGTAKPASVTLHQAHFPLPADAGQALVSQVMARANELAQSANSCTNFDNLAKQTNSPLSGALGTFPINQLSAQLQSVVANLPVGKPSPPTRTDDGIIVVMVCHRTEEQKEKEMTPAQRREEIRERLIEERLTLAAEQYLRSLRRAAIVDIRL